MKAYDKVLLDKVDGKFVKKGGKVISIKPSKKPKEYVESVNKHWEETGFIYRESKPTTKAHPPYKPPK